MGIYMNYQNFIAITNRHLCTKTDFLTQIQYIAGLHPKAIVLREKDLPLHEYIALAEKVLQICEKEDTELILHNYAEAVNVLKHPNIHLPLPILTDSLRQIKPHISVLGTSVHSVQDALLAKQLGCTYIFAGNIFETTCKPGLLGKGLVFLKSIVDAVDLPVYAIGGITTENISDVLTAGAAGGCMMSGFMCSTQA